MRQMYKYISLALVLTNTQWRPKQPFRLCAHHQNRGHHVEAVEIAIYLFITVLDFERCWHRALIQRTSFLPQLAQEGYLDQEQDGKVSLRCLFSSYS